MTLKLIEKITLIVILLAFGLTNANAITVDVGTNVTNATNWTFTDGTNALSPLFNNDSAFYEGKAYTGGSSDFSGWWQANLEFSVSALNTNIVPYLEVGTFSADDRAALFLNDQLLQMVGIYGYNHFGYFNWSKGSALVDVTNFQDNYIAAATPFLFDLSGILQEGNNVLKIIVNDTNNGIWGNTTNVVDVNTSLRFLGSVEYSQTETAPVPEPSTILLLGSGILGLGWYGRKRKNA